MIMADTVSFDSLLNTTAGMTAIVSNTKHDDDVINVTGVDWFTYAGKTASTIYVSGNNFIGFGQNAEQLKIWRRDGAIYYVYRQEGTLTSGKRFLKIRVEGYVYYSSTSSSYALKYEVFLIEGQTLFINVVQRPTSSSYTGTSSITDGNNTTNLNISVSSTVPISILVKNAGVSQEIVYEKYSDLVITSITVSKMPDKTTYYQKELFDKTGLKISGTTSTGETVSVTDYELSGYDSSSPGTKTITVTSGDASATFEVTVLTESLTGISITTLPSKTEYHINGEFNPSGISVSASTSDGNTVTLNSDQLIYSGFDSSSPGNKTITVSYNGMTSSFDITIMVPVSIQAQGYSGTAYFIGDTSNVSVSYINATYSDGITDSHINSGYTVTQVDTSTAGQKNAIVDYFGITTEVLVNVLDSYNAQAGTPNLEDVTISFNLDTGIMDIVGTGEFLPYYRLENVPSSLNQKIKILNIGNGITKIPDGLFYKVNILESISFSNTLIEIGNSNFTDNNIITTLDFPESLKTIGSSSFYGLSNLQEITFHEGLETIKEQAFNDCPLVKNLVLPSTLKNMVYSFRKSALENLEIGGEGALFSASGGSGINGVSAKNIIIRGGTIKQNTFYSGKNIESVNLNGNVVFDGYGQFQNCSNLSNVIIGDGITSIPQSCFSGCAIETIVIPDSVIELGQTAFSYCKSLKKITLSKNIKKIPNSCFSSCGFETFTIPDDSLIEELENVVFQGCSNLKMVYIGKNVKTIGPGCFASIGSPSTIIQINQKKDAISGSPWAATNAIVDWLIKATKIEIISLPSKLKYKKDEHFNGSGLSVKVTYNNGTSAEISDYTISYPDMSSAGTKTVTITYDEQTATFDIDVIAISKIEITTLPNKLEYRKNETLDTTGLVVSTVWTDGSKETLADGYTVSDLDSAETGEKIITITYQDFTTTFTVEVVADAVGIRISHYPIKTYYKIGELLDLTGLVVVVVRQDGTEKEITDYTVSGFDSSKAGVRTITVSYQTEIGGIETFVGYDEFEIKVTKDGKNPFEDNTDPINVKVHWINGEFEDLTNEHIQSNSLSLQESLCNKAYFIFGGCISNQITFKCYHPQFVGTDETTYPSGKIEVYLECKGTEIKIFTGEIATGERDANSFVRTIVAYDYLYKLRNTDIAWWYKNNTKDKQMVLTQKQFRDALFKYLGIEQVDVKLKYDNAYVPNTANSSEMNAVNILEDLCLQNNVFGWMNRDGKFEYKKLKKNCKHRGTTVSGVETFDFYESAVHLDRFKSFKATEGRVWYFNYVYTDPDPSGEVFTSGEPTAQDAYERNVFYNRNSFFVGNQDWLNYAYDANEYGDYTRTKPKYAICYGTVAEDIIKKQYYRAQGYSVEVQGNPFNMVGQTVEMTHSKLSEDGSAIQWVIHSYIMSRTLKLGITGLIDTYTANNSPYNGNNQQLGKNTPEITSTINRTRSEMPTISYAEFTDGTESGIATIDDFTDSSGSSSTELKKAQLRCVKRIKKADYDALVAAGTDRADTLYFTFEEE
jgi:hypothetical protein